MHIGRKAIFVVAALVVVALLAFTANYCGGSSGKKAPILNPTPAASAPATVSPTAPVSPKATSSPKATISPSPKATASPTPPARVTVAPCAYTEQWGIGSKTASPMSQSEAYALRVGQNDCYDRVVIDINGPAPVGYTVGYVSVVSSDAKGDPVPVKGAAALAVSVHAPDFGSASNGHQPSRPAWTVGQVLADTPGWVSLRQVKYAGGFEGYSSFAVGVSAELPFLVSTFLDGTVTHVIIDVAYPVVN